MKIVSLAIAASLAAPLLTVPAAAQDMPGAVDLGALSRSQVQAGAMRGHAERDGARYGPTRARGDRTAQTCANAATMRRPAGEKGRKVDRLRALCRQAGY